MSSALSRGLPRLRAPLQSKPPSLILSASYAKKKGSGLDPRLDTIKNTLYPRLKHKHNAYRALRQAIPSTDAHETIERAWQLHQRQLREARHAELSRMYDRMTHALAELEKVDAGLFYEATITRDPRKLTKDEAEELKNLKGPARNAAAARIEGLFPREMRLPTDTPRTAGWDHAWKAPNPDGS